MDTTLAILAFLFALIGIAGCIVPALPGVILSYAGLVCAYFCSYSQISTAALLIWLAVTLFVSVADDFLPAYMTRRFCGSRAGAIGATIGTVVGFFFIPPLGILLADPRTAPVVQHALREETAAMTNGGGDGLMPPEAMAQMFDALTLRNMINFGGPQAEEKLTKLLETLRDAVK